MMHCCARCGIEFDRGNTNSQYCDDCKTLHRLEAGRAQWRDRCANRKKPKRPKCSVSIEDVLKLAPEYGFPPYEYGETVVKIKNAKAERNDAG